jgi:transposase-like protein
MGLLERHGEVRTMVVRNNKRKSLRPEINANVEAGSMVYTDALRSYNDLNYDYMHNVINHAEKSMSKAMSTRTDRKLLESLKADHRRNVCEC